MQYTESKLKLVLAQILPEKIRVTDYSPFIYWSDGPVETGPVLETEMLHACWLAEQQLHKGGEQSNYYAFLYTETVREPWITSIDDQTYMVATAGWQHRTRALAKAKGIDILQL